MFGVQYYAAFSQEWKEYVAPAWNARAIRHDARADAEKRMSRLAADHPRDKFRVIELAV